MKTIKGFLFMALLGLLMLSACGDDEEDYVPPATDFDTTELTSKTYKLGDRIQADIPIDTKGNFINDLNLIYCAVDGNACSTLDRQESQVNSAASFTYKLDYTIPSDSPKLQSGGKLRIIIIADIEGEASSPEVLNVTLDIE